jgi:hypothetical protein
MSGVKREFSSFKRKDFENSNLFPQRYRAEHDKRSLQSIVLLVQDGLLPRPNVSITGLEALRLGVVTALLADC